jgi:hypothetical protein
MDSMKEIWEQLMAMLLLDMMHDDLLRKGYAINGSGVAIDMDEIKKAEEMYEEEEEGE